MLMMCASCIRGEECKEYLFETESTLALVGM